MQKIYKYKDTIFDVINKNRRRINAYIWQNQIKRIKALILLLLITLNYTSVFAIENNNVAYGDYTIQCFKDPYCYIYYNGKMQANNEYYYIKDNVEYSAYCLNLGLNGAEDTENGYTVDVKQKITDEKLRLIVLNCYPYKSVEELGLNNIHEARFASQFAIWCYVAEGLDINLIEPISSMNDNLVQAIKNIYNAKDGNWSDYKVSVDLSYSEQYNQKINNEDYYLKRVKVLCNNIMSFDIKVKDEDAIIQQTEKDNEYIIGVPVSKVKQNNSIDLDIDIIAKENVALWGQSKRQDFQNVAVTLKTEYSTKIQKTIKFDDYETEIKILKVDSQTGIPLAGVKYEILDTNNNIIGKYTTNSDGKISFILNNSTITKLKIREYETLPEYRIDSKTYTYEVKPNDKLNLKFENSKKMGTIEIIKKTKEYNKYTNLPENSPLKNVYFNILDENNNIVDTLITNELGYAKSKELPLGKYYIKEFKTVDYYELLSEIIEVEVIKDGDNVNVQILNNNVFIEEKLPVTGR